MRFAGLLPWIAGLLFASVVSALLMIAFGDGTLRLLPMFLAVALAHALLLGWPAAWAARRRGLTHPAFAILVGGLIGVLPLGIMLLLSPSGGFNAWSGDTPTMIDGVRTLAGWLEFAQVVGMLAAIGAGGGLAFWLAMRACGAWTTDEGRRPLVSIALAMTAVAVAGFIFWLPERNRDRSCHNPFRDGAQYASPKFTVDIDLPAEQWREVATFLQRFAAEKGLSFRGDLDYRPDSFGQMTLSACAEPGIVIAAYSPLRMIGSQGISVVMYDQRLTLEWRALALDLVAALEGAFKERVRFRGTEGQVIDKPAILRP